MSGSPPADLRVTDVVATPASPADLARGIYAWVRCVVDDALVVDGVTLRRARDGRAYLGYPARVDGGGRRHHVVRPVGDAARRAVEAAVFAALCVPRETLR